MNPTASRQALAAGKSGRRIRISKSIPSMNPVKRHTYRLGGGFQFVVQSR